MDGQITVTRAHDLTKEIEQNLRDKFGQATHIALHVEPIKINELLFDHDEELI